MGFELKAFNLVVNNSAYSISPSFNSPKMDGEIEKNSGIIEEKEEGFVNKEIEECRESNFSSDFLVSEATVNEEHSNSSSSEDSSSLGWHADVTHCGGPDLEGGMEHKQGSSFSEAELMKERFAKLLLGEDMSGCGNGVCSALAISNSITNLCATLFGQIWRLEPLHLKKKSMWRREIECLLSVSDHIVELAPSWQSCPDGSKLEVMTSRPRQDLYVNLPALRKLDKMLLEILDSFVDTEFWYIDQGIVAQDADVSPSLRKPLPRQEEKWWLPVPRVPAGGLTENSRKQLQYRRDCTNQILKAAMAINSITLADMVVPESFFESLPKSAKAGLGDLIYRYITSEQFSPECLLECLDLSSEHQALEIVNRVEASIYIWRKKATNSKPINKTNRFSSKSSWEMMKDLVVDVEKRELFANRAESLMLCLKLRFPGLPQTALDMSKIQYNKDVGKSILESYSRVLESLAFNIVARIDDLFYIDDLTKHSDRSNPLSKVGLIAHKTVDILHPVPISSTPYKSAFTSPSFSPNKGAQSPYLDIIKLPPRGFGVKKILTDYLTIDGGSKKSSEKVSISDSLSSENVSRSASNSSISSENAATFVGLDSTECANDALNSPLHDSEWEE